MGRLVAHDHVSEFVDHCLLFVEFVKQELYPLVLVAVDSVIGDDSEQEQQGAECKDGHSEAVNSHCLSNRSQGLGLPASDPSALPFAGPLAGYLVIVTGGCDGGYLAQV